jgi:hypothetical protein
MGGLFRHFIDGINSRHPDDAGPFSCCDLNGHGIHATDGGVEGNRSQDVNTWHKRVNKSRSFCGGGIMGLDHETGQSPLQTTMRKLKVGCTSWHDIRTRVNV